MKPFSPIWFIVSSLLCATADAHEEVRAGATPPPQTHFVRVAVEEGFLAVFHNRLRFGSDGTETNLVTEGGEDILFPTRRYAAALDVERHRITVLYQPIDIRTRETLRRDLVIDDTTFAAGTSVAFRYGFSFWRGGWTYDVDPGPGELALGAGMQVRNAAIEFRGSDGRFVSNRNVGPVPLLSVRAQRPVGARGFVGFEADGFYAPIKYLNGGDTEVEGSILDANLRTGFATRTWLEVHATARYLGGGASSEGRDSSSNYLHTGSLAVGATARF